MHQRIDGDPLDDDADDAGEALLTWTGDTLVYQGTVEPDELIDILAAFIADNTTYH